MPASAYKGATMVSYLSLALLTTVHNFKSLRDVQRSDALGTCVHNSQLINSIKSLEWLLARTRLLLERKSCWHLEDLKLSSPSTRNVTILCKLSLRKIQQTGTKISAKSNSILSPVISILNWHEYSTD